MISNRFLVLISLFLALCACKTQSTIATQVAHYPLSTIHDSVSITYKQGKEQPTPSLILCNPQRVAGDNNRSYEVATRYDGKPKSLPSGGGAKSVESAESVRDLTIRVDTVFVERWHTQVLQPAGRSFSDSGPSESNANGLSAKRSQFYKNCTKGFWILLLLSLGRIAFRIMKAIYLRK